jgi:hypothetical protein
MPTFERIMLVWAIPTRLILMFLLRQNLFLSWLLNVNAQWKAPVAMPQDGQMYSWNEDSTSWVVVL